MRHISVPSPFHIRSVRMVCVHTVRRVPSPSRLALDSRTAIISIKYAAHCHGMHFPLFVNYYNFGDNRMIVTSKCAIKTLKVTWLFQLFSYFSPQFFFPALSIYFLFDRSYNSSHLRTNSINFSPLSEDKNWQHSLQANTRIVVEEM